MASAFIHLTGAYHTCTLLAATIAHAATQ